MFTSFVKAATLLQNVLETSAASLTILEISAFMAS